MAWLATDAGDLQTYLVALAAMFEQVYSLVAEQGDPDQPANFFPGWSVLLDPTNCPTSFLPYLAQFNGTMVPPGTDDTSARSIITAEAGFQRGTAAAIFAAAQRNLTGTQSVVMLERIAANGTSADAYHFVLIVRPEEVISVTALTDAVNAVKPAGIQWTLVQTDNWLWNQAIGTWNSDTMTWNQTATQRP